MRRPVTPWIVALVGCLMLSASVQAGWLAIQNDTPVPLVIQEVTDTAGQKHVQSVRLLPGEVYREYRPSACEKKVRVLERTCTGKPVICGKLEWKADDAAVRVESDGKQFKLTPVRPPKATAEASAPPVPNS